MDEFKMNLDLLISHHIHFSFQELTLPRKNPVEGEKIVISGWGKTMNGQLEAVRNLTSGTQMVVKNETCIEKFEEWFILFPFTDFCAGKEKAISKLLDLVSDLIKNIC